MMTVILHSVVIAILIVGLPGSSAVREIKAQPTVIQAKLVIEKPVSRPKAKPAPSKPVPKPVAKPKPKPKPVAKPKPKPKPKPKAEPKRPSPEELKKQQREIEKKRQQQLLDQLRREQEAELAEAMAAEDQESNDEELSSTYGDLIRILVQQNWRTPPTARNGMKTVLRITTVPTGEVVSYEILESSRSKAFDQSVIDAVMGLGAIDALAELARKDPAAYNKHFRRFRFSFQPTELRR